MTLCANLTVCLSLPPLTNGTISYTDQTLGLSTAAIHTCNPGFIVNGVSTRACNEGGSWSGVAPTCEVDCGSPTIITNGSPGTPTNTTYLGTVTYTCVSGYEVSIGVTTTMATCMASGDWRPLPTCQGVSCGDPPTITNASPGTPSSTTYRGAVTYTCDTGYWIRRGFTRARATCMAGKKWGRLPTCTIVDCGSPPTVRNGYPGTPTSTTFGGTVSYMCNSNRYHMSGSATVTCEASGSWSTIPTCSAICENLYKIENGAIYYDPDTTPRTEGVIAVHSCVSGYQLSGVTFRACMDVHNGMGGVWTGLMPSCTVCDSLTLAHGVISYSPSTTPRLEGGVAIHSCDEGYGLSPSVRIRTCQPDRTWSGQNIICHAIMCLPLTHYNGSIEYSSPRPPYSFGTQAIYLMISCPEGTETRGGDSTRTCTGDGHSTVGVWSGTAPICAGPVFLSLQGISYSTNNSNILVSRIGTTNNTSLTCHTNSTTCCRGRDNPRGGSGEWLFPNGTTISRNSVTGSGFYYRRFHQVLSLYRRGDIQTPLGTYCCKIPDSGGEMRTFCANLVAIRCPPLIEPMDKTIMYSNTEEEGKYIFGTEATYSCFSGFGLSISSTQTKTCVDDNNGIVGRFGGSEPTCERITCSVLPSITNGTIDYPSGNTAPYYDYGTTATYQCNPGYNRTSGDSERTCTGDGNTPSGQWDGIAPQCPPVDCGTPPSISNGSPGIPTTTTFTGTGTYSCNDGYALFENTTSTCQANATWSRPPECRGITLTGVQSGVLIFIGGSVTITCTTDSPADSIMLLQDNQPLHETNSQTTLMYTISVTDSIHGNIFKCEANLTGRTYPSNTAFDMITIFIKIPQQPINASIRTSSPSTPLIGEPYIVTCTVSLLPGLTRTPTAQWMMVIMGEEIKNLNRSTLNFAPLRTSDVGRYRCQGNVSTTVQSQPLSDSNNIDIIVQIPTPAVTISRSPSSSALFANISVVTFTCQVSIPRSIDTPVNLSLTWTREVYRDEDDTTTEVIMVNSTTKTIERRWTFNDLSSRDQRVTCNGTLSSASSFIRGNSSINEDTLSVAGVFLMFNGSVFADNTTSVPARDVRVIQCHSDKIDTFNENQHGWTFPNSTKITNVSTLAVATREGGHLTLTRVGNSSLPAGEYCCKAPDARGTSHTLCVHVEQSRSVLLRFRLVGGVVGGVVIVLILVVVVIVIANFVFKSRREKLTINKTTKCNVPPVSLKGGVSTGEIHTYEMIEMGHEYEEVSKFQGAVGGEYEIIGAPSQTTDSESKAAIKTEPSPPTPPQPSGNDIEFTECVAYSTTTHSRPPQPTGL